MRRLLITALALTTTMWVAGAWFGSDVNADTPVVVLAADDVILHLPRSPSVDRIVSDLHAELRATAAIVRDNRIASALERMDQHDDMLRQVASAPVDMFDNGEAAATATAVYDIQLDSDAVTIVLVTVELVPGFGSTAGSREHEDGHALINHSVARRCATDALRFSVESGYRGDSLVNSMINYLSASGDPVHARYHELVEHARYGQHIRLARQAVTDTPGCVSP